jgi:hypothetical protein
MLRYGVRWDYDGEITKDDGNLYHKFQLQPNAGKIPSSVKQWRENNGGTHAVMAVMYIPMGMQPDPKVFQEEAEKAVATI